MFSVYYWAVEWEKIITKGRLTISNRPKTTWQFLNFLRKMQKFDRNFLSFSSLNLQTHWYLHSLLLRKSQSLLTFSELWINYSCFISIYAPNGCCYLKKGVKERGLLFPSNYNLFYLVPIITNLSYLHFSCTSTLYRRRQWQLTPVLLPGESQGRRSLVGCRLWGRTESDTTEVT